MSTAMKAAFTLTLEDKLTAGLKAIEKQFEQLKNKGGELNLGKLERAGDTLRTLRREFTNLTSDMRGVEGAADRAWSAMKRMAAVPIQRMRAGLNAIGPGSQFGQRVGVIGGAVAGLSVVRPVQAYADLQNIALHSAITQNLSGPAAFAETNRLTRLFNKDALETGQSATSIAQAFQDLLQTGMTPQRAEALLPIHSRAATAYNITPEALGHAVFALSDSFKISEDQMPGALASMALASKEGRFKVEDFSHFLPSIGGDMAKLGMTGRGSADQAFTALETVMKYSPEPGSGAANFTQFMNDLTAPHTARQFALHNRGMAPETKAILEKYHIQGVNLPKLLESARIKGVDPLTAVIGTLHKITDNLPPDVKGEVLGAFFPNMQARTAAQAMLDHPNEMATMSARLAGADTNLLNRDFETAHAATKVTLATGAEAGAQIERRAGEGFEPIIDRLTGGLTRVIDVINKLDDAGYKKATDAVLGLAGAALAATSALGVIGFVAPAVGAGSGLLAAAAAGAAPFILPAAVVAAPIATDIFAPPDVKLDLTNRLARGPMDMDRDDFYPGAAPPDLSPPRDQQPQEPSWMSREVDRLMHFLEMPLRGQPPLIFPGADVMPPIRFELPQQSDQHPPPPPAPPDQHVVVDVNVHADQGTNATATVTHSTDGTSARVATPNPGPATNLP